MTRAATDTAFITSGCCWNIHTATGRKEGGPCVLSKQKNPSDMNNSLVCRKFSGEENCAQLCRSLLAPPLTFPHSSLVYHNPATLLPLVLLRLVSVPHLGQALGPAEELGLVPSIYIKWLISTCNFSFRGLDAFFWPLCALTQVCCTHIYIQMCVCVCV